ncbi:hypothetical protein EIL50_01850 [bacterium NHP-B]|nr:hypothetical protein EIL50_01850 [bacterium NHP-B]
MKMYTFGFALCALCVTSLGAMDPSPTENAPEFGSAITRGLKKLDPPLASMKGWAEHVNLTVMAEAPSEDLMLSVPFDLPWDEEDIHRAWLDSSPDGADAFEITFAELKRMTYGGLLDTIEGFMSNREQEGEPAPVVHLSAHLRLRNLSHALPKSVLLPHVNQLFVQGTHFGKLDGWRFPNLTSAQFMDVGYFNTEYVAPPSLCVLSADRQEPPVPLTLKAERSYALPAAFGSHIQGGRLTLQCSAGTHAGAIFKKAGSLTGHNAIQKHLDEPCGLRIPLSFYAKNDNPWAHRGVEALDIMWFPSQTEASFVAEKTPTPSKDGFITREDGLYRMSSPADTSGTESEELVRIPPEMIDHILSFLQDPFHLFNFAQAFWGVPSVKNLIWRQVVTLDRPFVMKKGSYIGEGLCKNFPLVHDWYAPGSYLSRAWVSTADKHFVWGLPHQMPDGVVMKAGDPKSLDLPEHAHVVNVRESVTYTPVFGNAALQQKWEQLCEDNNEDEKYWVRDIVLDENGDLKQGQTYEALMGIKFTADFLVQKGVPFATRDNGFFQVYVPKNVSGVLGQKFNDMMDGFVGVKMRVHWYFDGYSGGVSIGDFFLEKPNPQADKDFYSQGIRREAHNLPHLISAVALDHLFRNPRDRS